MFLTIFKILLLLHFATLHFSVRLMSNCMHPIKGTSMVYNKYYELLRSFLSLILLAVHQVEITSHQKSIQSIFQSVYCL